MFKRMERLESFVYLPKLNDYFYKSLPSNPRNIYVSLYHLELNLTNLILCKGYVHIFIDYLELTFKIHENLNCIKNAKTNCILKIYMVQLKMSNKNLWERVKMEVLKYIVLAVYLIVCVALIIVATIQTKDTSGTSATITGSSTNNFYEKNKGRTAEGRLKRITIILGIAFGVLAIITGILYVI